VSYDFIHVWVLRIRIHKPLTLESWFAICSSLHYYRAVSSAVCQTNTIVVVRSHLREIYVAISHVIQRNTVQCAQNIRIWICAVLPCNSMSECIFISVNWTEWMVEILFSFDVCMCVRACVCARAADRSIIASTRLKLRTSNLTRMFPGTVRTWPLKIFRKGGVAMVTWPPKCRKNAFKWLSCKQNHWVEICTLSSNCNYYFHCRAFANGRGYLIMGLSRITNNVRPTGMPDKQNHVHSENTFLSMQILHNRTFQWVVFSPKFIYSWFWWLNDINLQCVTAYT